MILAKSHSRWPVLAANGQSRCGSKKAISGQKGSASGQDPRSRRPGCPTSGPMQTATPLIEKRSLSSGHGRPGGQPSTPGTRGYARYARNVWLAVIVPLREGPLPSRPRPGPPRAGAFHVMGGRVHAGRRPGPAFIVGRWRMFADLLPALLAAVAAGVLPGYFWAVVLSPRADLAERLTWSSVLSVASVPVIALFLAKLAGTGTTLWVARVAVALVAVSGALALAVRGPTRALSGPVLPRAPAIRDPGTLALVGMAFVAALAVVLISLQLHTRIPGWLLIVVAVLLIVAGMVAAWNAKPAPTDSPGGAEKPAEEKAGRVGPA